MSTPRDVHTTGGSSGATADGEPVNRILVFTLISFALMMMSIDSTIVATALDTLQHGLHTSINWAGWTLTAYSFGFVLMLPVSGKLSEQYGRRRVFLWSVVVFTAASLLCGLADNIYVLIALRAVQAAGGAGFTPSATGIVVDYFGDARDRAVSLFGSIFSVGSMIGPIFGGLFVTYWTWRGVFLVNVPLGIVVLVLTLYYIPKDKPGAADLHEPIDAAGMSLLGVGLLTGMLAVSYLGEGHAQVWSFSFVVLLAASVAALWAFFRHVNHSEHPFITPLLIHGPGFGPVNVVNGLFGGISLGVVALIPLYATNRYGVNALDSGTLLIAEGAAAILFVVAAALMLRRSGYHHPLYIGSVVIAVGTLLLALGPVSQISAYTWLAGSAFLVGVGVGTINPASRNAGLQLAPEHSATLAALRSMSMQIGSIITIGVTTAILARVRDTGVVQAWIYVAAALVILISLPLIGRIQEHHGAW